MRQRAALLAHVQQTNSQYTLPAIGKNIASQAKRLGVADRVADPAVPKSLEVALALSPYDDQRRTDLELSIVNNAKHQDAQTFSRLRSGPGVGKICALVMRYARHDIHRFPRGQDLVSYGCLVQGAKASTGTRYGPCGQKIGKADLTWAFSAAAVLCLRHNPAGQTVLAKLEHRHGRGKALTVLAHKRARAVYDLRQRQTGFARGTFRQRSREQRG
jgi:transposase